MRGGSLRRFKVYTPSGGQKGGTLFKFTSLSSPPPFVGTWDQIQRQRGAGLSDVVTSGRKRVQKRRAASASISDEINRLKRRKDIFGV